MTSVLKRLEPQSSEPTLVAEVGPAAGRYAVAVAFETNGVTLVESAELADLPETARAELLAAAAETLIRHIRDLRAPRRRF
jgi:hypothetical protein